jgi:glycosyltransferase involved in cell wall biosynthesis
MPDAPLVTIAIPTYNRAGSHLPGVIEAALDQTWTNIEVLVGDNASTDDTPAVVGRYADPRLVHVRHPVNLGANGNFNRLLELARGEWFLLLHDDDLVDPRFVEVCLKSRQPGVEYGVIRTGVRAIDGEGRVLKERPNTVQGPRPVDLYRAWFRAKTGMYLCNTLYRTAALRAIGGWHSLHNLLEDNYAVVKITAAWPRLEVRDVLASFRYSYDQRTFQVPVHEWCEDFLGLLDLITRQVNAGERADIEEKGRRFFGELCVRRANVVASPLRRLRARLQVARSFGLRTLRLGWRLPSSSPQ